MNLKIIAEVEVKLPSGKQKKLVEDFDVLNTPTDVTYHIIGKDSNLKEQIERYKEYVKTRFLDEEYKVFDSYEDEVDHAFNGTKNYKIEIRTKEEQVQEHIDSLNKFIDVCVANGYEISFESI
jgi:hypothetical protein